MYKFFLLILATCLYQAINAQQEDSLPIRETTAADTVGPLQNLVVTGYIGRQYLIATPASVAVISHAQLQQQSPVSLVPVMNTVPGVRMEERSPGSYRLSLRGSLLRSPFGVRNVKIYMDEWPLTDAGGNSYFNALSLPLIERMEILKGPDGSLFGANSGGVVLVQPFAADSSLQWNAGIGAGSYGLFNQFAQANMQSGQHQWHIGESYQRADGYREQSQMSRLFVQAGDHWQYNKRNSIDLFLLYSDMQYETPGGLTLAQFKANPRKARQASGQLPGAVEQQAAIYNKLVFGGITHRAALSNRLQHVLAIFGSRADFENPFITNYETRLEKTAGFRTYLRWSTDEVPGSNFKWENNTGVEWQQTRSAIRNYNNNSGEKGELQAANTIKSDQHFFFTRFKATVADRLTAEAAVSLNYYQYNFKDATRIRKQFDPQWMPRLALAYRFLRQLTGRLSIGRGYSPPTIAEVRPSDNQVYQGLQPENGWNMEAGFRIAAVQNRLWVDMAVYRYRLRQAIVRRLNANGTEFFINAGGTRQTGIESQLSYQVIRNNKHSFIRDLQCSNSTTLSFFRFTDYQSGNDNFSGKRLTGVPEEVIVTHATAQLPAAMYVFAQHTYTSRLPLNDANTVYAKQYHLLLAKAGWRFAVSDRMRLEVYAGADNLLNQSYSLGNDLNAAGSRYYNAAPRRNYFAGIVLQNR